MEEVEDEDTMGEGGDASKEAGEASTAKGAEVGAADNEGEDDPTSGEESAIATATSPKEAREEADSAARPHISVPTAAGATRAISSSDAPPPAAAVPVVPAVKPSVKPALLMKSGTNLAPTKPAVKLAVKPTVVVDMSPEVASNVDTVMARLHPDVQARMQHLLGVGLGEKPKAKPPPPPPSAPGHPHVNLARHLQGKLAIVGGLKVHVKTREYYYSSTNRPQPSSWCVCVCVL